MRLYTLREGDGFLLTYTGGNNAVTAILLTEAYTIGKEKIGSSKIYCMSEPFAN
jgi:hypothetical protein